MARPDQARFKRSGRLGKPHSAYTSSAIARTGPLATPAAGQRSISQAFEGFRCGILLCNGLKQGRA